LHRVTTVARAQSGPRFYGWWGIVLATFIIIWITNGLTVGAITAFDKSLLELLGVSQGQLKFGDTIMLLSTAVITPLSGWAADRFGVRPVMAFGVVALAAAFYGMGQADSLTGVYWLRFLMGVSLSCAGLAICVVIVSRWFVGRRGLALGLMLAGTSLANALLPQVTTQLIAADGWRAAAQWVALGPLLLLPLILFAIKEWPAQLGLEAYGASTNNAPATAPMGNELTYGDILRRKDFWLIGVAAFATFFCILGVSYNLFRHMGLLGIAPQAAAVYFFPLFLGGLVGKLGSGLLSDMFGRKPSWILNLALMMAGAALLATYDGEWLLLAVSLFGLGWGGNYTLLQAVAADAFGARSLGRVMGAITVLDAGGGALGPWITGLLFDRFGTFAQAFGLMVALIGVAIVMALLLRTSSVGAREASAN
jgi:MFS family permease